MEDVIQFAAEKGLVALLLVLFIFFFYKQYDKLSTRLSNVEDFIKKELLDTVKESNKIHQEAIQTISKCGKN